MIRTFQSTLRDPKAFYLYIVQTLFIVLFGMALYHNLSQDYGPDISHINVKLINNRVGSFFFLLLNSYFGVLTCSTFKMQGESRIIFKEISGRMYSTTLYYFARFFCDMIFLIIPVAVFVYPVSQAK